MDLLCQWPSRVRERRASSSGPLPPWHNRWASPPGCCHVLLRQAGTEPERAAQAGRSVSRAKQPSAVQGGSGRQCRRDCFRASACRRTLESRLAAAFRCPTQQCRGPAQCEGNYLRDGAKPVARKKIRNSGGGDDAGSRVTFTCDGKSDGFRLLSTHRCDTRQLHPKCTAQLYLTRLSSATLILRHRSSVKNGPLLWPFRHSTATQPTRRSRLQPRPRVSQEGTAVCYVRPHPNHKSLSRILGTARNARRTFQLVAAACKSGSGVRTVQTFCGESSRRRATLLAASPPSLLLKRCRCFIHPTSQSTQGSEVFRQSPRTSPLGDCWRHQTQETHHVAPTTSAHRSTRRSWHG